eukprot:TRINITY_DN5778_c0_g1_i4.p1 TRINITY_DN5778_c0_g1~~TRINITY_DN5778_c0_g1_i4.p1  ORF type:complete len:406 (+),score=35.66 TRINITY_DN5778_c0_g1_i4:328-1545(+)
MLLGAPFWGIISDKYGRRRAYLFSTIITFVFSIISALSPSFYFLVVTRAIVGFGLGGSSIPFSLLAEFLPSAKRGVFLCMVQLFWAIGSILEAAIALAVFSNVGNHKYNWRILIVVSSIPAFLSLFCYFILPESFRYYMNSGNEDKAHELLAKAAIWNKKKAPLNPILSTREDSRGRIFDLLKPEFLRVTLLVWMCWFLASFVYYGMVLLVGQVFTHDSSSGMSCNITKSTSPSFSPNECSLSKQSSIHILITATAELPGVLFTIVFIDLIGRKWTLTLEYIIGAISIGILMFCLNKTIDLLMLSVARAIMTGIFQAVSVYTPEAYPTHIRSTALGSANAWARIAGVFTPFVVTEVWTKSKIAGLAIFCGLSVIGAIVSAFLPDIKQKMVERVTEVKSLHLNFPE